MEDETVLCSGLKENCQNQNNFTLDPRNFNLSEDFIYVERDWGSLFYRHLGRKSKPEAKQHCSQYGDTVHLPIPTSEKENQFYQTYFTDDKLWLDVSYDDQDSVFKSDFGHSFIQMIETVTVVQNVSHFEWINFNHSGHNDIILSSDGQWGTADILNPVNSICVYKIKPEENCTKCFDSSFCQFKDKTRQQTECICSIGRQGDFCRENLCSCKNGGVCSKEGCICQRPFFGQECESSNAFFCNNNYEIFLDNEQIFVFGPTPMIIDLFGELY